MSGPLRAALRDDVRDAIRAVGAEAGAEAVAVAVHDLGSGATWAVGGDEWFHAASTMKVAVLVALVRAAEAGRFPLHGRLGVRNRFTSVADGSSFRVASSRDAEPRVHHALGRTLPIAELARHMIATSSNLATNLLVDLVGIDDIRATTDALGLSAGIDVRRGVEDEAAFEAGISNRVTASGLVGLFVAICSGRAASADGCRFMLDVLADQRFNRGIPAGLPSAIRDRTVVAHKTGDISTVAHDAGLVFPPDSAPYALALLTRWAPGTGQRPETLARLTRVVHDAIRPTQPE